jgi:hypothetical protein
MIGNAYDSMQKPAFVFDGRNILNGLGSGKICVSKYRFLGLHQPQREEAEGKRDFVIRKLRTTQINGIQ